MYLSLEFWVVLSLCKAQAEQMLDQHVLSWSQRCLQLSLLERIMLWCASCFSAHGNWRGHLSSVWTVAWGVLFWRCIARPPSPPLVFHDWTIVRSVAWVVGTIAFEMVVHAELNSSGCLFCPVRGPRFFALWLSLRGLAFLALTFILAFGRKVVLVELPFAWALC